MFWRNKNPMKIKPDYEIIAENVEKQLNLVRHIEKNIIILTTKDINGILPRISICTGTLGSSHPKEFPLSDEIKEVVLQTLKKDLMVARQKLDSMVD